MSGRHRRIPPGLSDLNPWTNKRIPLLNHRENKMHLDLDLWTPRVQAEATARSGDRAVRCVELLRLRFQEGLPIRDIATRWNEDAAKLHHEFATARDESHTKWLPQ
jgi:hypothetical protein